MQLTYKCWKRNTQAFVDNWILAASWRPRIVHSYVGVYSHSLSEISSVPTLSQVSFWSCFNQWRINRYKPWHIKSYIYIIYISIHKYSTINHHLIAYHKCGKWVILPRYLPHLPRLELGWEAPVHCVQWPATDWPWPLTSIAVAPLSVEILNDSRNTHKSSINSINMSESST